MDDGYNFNLSPKVVLPFLAGLIGFVATWVISGHFEKEAATLLVATLAYGVIGVAAPPAVGVKQEEVVELAKRR